MANNASGIAGVSLLDVQTDDIDELHTWDMAGWECDYLQLTHGPLGFSTRLVAVEGLTIAWGVYRQKVYAFDIYSGTDLRLGLVVDARELPKACGREVRLDSGLYHCPGAAKEYTLGADTQVLDLAVSADLAETFAFGAADLATKHGHLVWQFPKEPRERMIHACRELTQAVASRQRAAGSSFAVNSASLIALRDRVLYAMRDALLPWPGEARPGPQCSDGPSQRYEIVKAAVEAMDHSAADDKLVVARLAEILGVSQRSIYSAFNHWFGIGPYEFHLVRRLHRFRDDLIEGERRHGKVTSVALNHGFDHFGRLSQQYARLFGELPRATMRRWAAKKS